MAWCSVYGLIIHTSARVYEPHKSTNAGPRAPNVNYLGPIFSGSTVVSGPVLSMKVPLDPYI
jgi:hypothetical protein